MATIFRMTSFAPREAMTTAEPPEPLTFSALRIPFIQTNPSADCRPGGEAFWCVLCVLWLIIRVHSCSFVVHNQLLITQFPQRFPPENPQADDADQEER